MSAPPSALKSSVGRQQRRGACRTCSAVMRPFFAVASQLRAAHGQSPIERRLVLLEHRDRNAGVGEAHRDAAAHRAESEHGGRTDRPRRRALRYIGDLRRRALGKERMPQRLRLRRLHEFDEVAAFARQAFVERQARPTASTASTHFSGAGSPRACLATSARAVPNNALGVRRRQATPRYVAQAGTGAAPRHFGQQTSYAVERVPRDHASRPVRCLSASAARIGSPLTIMRRPFLRRPRAAAAACRRRRAAVRSSLRASQARRRVWRCGSGTRAIVPGPLPCTRR